MDTGDKEIREAFRAAKLRRYQASPEVMVVEELGILNGRNRIDVAVLNGCIHGYEIKSSKDNLDRLHSQLSAYSRALQKLTFVAAAKHLDAIRAAAPEWVGLMLVEKGARGGISFRTVRRARMNPATDVVAMAQLLWRKEALEILSGCKLGEGLERAPRRTLYDAIAEKFSAGQLASAIKEKFKSRGAWRAAPLLRSCDG